MADKDQAAQDFNPKHRVVGAVVLVGLAVILLPLILRDRAPPAPTTPMAEGAGPNTKIVVTPLTPVPLPAEPAIPGTVKTIPPLTAVPAAPDAAAPAPAVAPAATTATTVRPRETVATAAPTEQPAHPKSAAAKGWIVQVGAFAKQDNADRLKEKLAHHGYATSVDKIASDKGPVLRVRVGPYASEAEARAAETRIQRELAVKGVVRTFP